MCSSAGPALPGAGDWKWGTELQPQLLARDLGVLCHWSDQTSMPSVLCSARQPHYCANRDRDRNSCCPK